MNTSYIHKRKVDRTTLPTTPHIEVEASLWQRGMTAVAGLDEAGRGPWAGPVYAAAVILPAIAAVIEALDGVHDSKKLSAARREALAIVVREVAITTGIGIATAQEIDARGIVPATRTAMQRALVALRTPAQALVIDALPLPDIELEQHVFNFADAISLSVAAASILAKTERDRYMIETAEAQFPGYGFAQHKGYGTKQHQAALNALGVCPLHRRSFAPVARRLTRSDACAS